MAKRKKKPSAASIHKIDRAHHKNEFLRKFKNLVTLVSNPKVFPLIPEKELERIYNFRFRATRIRAADGENIPAEILKDSKHFLSEALRTIYVPILANGTAISMDDYFTIGLTLSIYCQRLKAGDYAKALEVITALTPFYNYAELEGGHAHAIDELIFMMDYIPTLYSDMNPNIYILKPETKTEMEGKLCICFCLEIYCRQTEKIEVLLDGHNRPAMRVGWGISDPEPRIMWNKIKAEDLDLNSTIKGLTVDVYIQSHALIRLTERMDCVMPGLLYMNIWSSLERAKVVKDKNGKYLFEYYLFNSKAGYLKGEYIEGRIIIRTFLFLTYSGTPEGEKLAESTGLLKEDRKYLAIDKLSTFIGSDIPANERIKEIFIKAGCGSLFEMDDKVFIPPEDLKGKSTSELIAKYLGLAAPAEEVVE